MPSLLSIIESTISALTVGNVMLFRFWFAYLFKPFQQLPKELYNTNAMTAKMTKRQSFELVVEKKYVDQYETEINHLQKQIKELWEGPLLDYVTMKQASFWLIRMATVVAAFAGSLKWTFTVSLLQFIFLPYSLFVAIGYGLETIFALYSGHIIVFPLLTHLAQLIVPDAYNISIAIDPLFLLSFLAADQLICALCLFETPKGKTAPVSHQRLFDSIFYGFLNCKTYYLVLLPLCFGLRIPVIPWIIDATLGLSSAISKETGKYWEVLFYHVHRMGHMALVYCDAHRFHHYLHDTTAFDAHIFGSGAPEEWLILVFDAALAAGMGTVPACLSAHVLSVSWYNKWGFHTRSAASDLDGDNFHADHHTYHTVNYGFTYPYEMVMKTCRRGAKDKVVWSGYTIQRLEDEKGQTITMRFVPNAQ